MVNKKRILIVTEFLQKGQKRQTRTMDEVTTNMVGGYNRVTTTTRTMDKSTNKLRNSLETVKLVAKRFRMELLGIMFAGMALFRVFGGLIKRQLDLFGITELFNSLMIITFLPTMKKLLPKILEISEAIARWDDSTKSLVGNLILVFAGIGLILMIVGQASLGIDALIIWFSKLGTKIKGVGTFFAGLSATVVAVIAVIVAVVVGMYLAWKNNFLNMKEVVTDFIDSVKQFFGGLGDFLSGFFDVIVGIITGDFDKLKEGIKKMFFGLLDMLVGAAKMVINLIKGIVIGAITIIYNIIKVIVDSAVYLINKLSGLLGTDKTIEFKMPDLPKEDIFANSHSLQLDSPMTSIFNVNANIASDYDVDRLTEQINRNMVEKYEGSTQIRGI